MTRFAHFAACAAVILVLQATASAELSLRIGPQRGVLDALLFPPQGRQFFDLVFEETGPPENEGLFAYDLALRVVRPGGIGGGMRLDGAERPPDNFVLDVPSGSLFSVAESDADYLLINVASNEELTDINTGDKAARVFYTLEPGAWGNYWLVFDPDSTVFGSADPDQPIEIPVDLTDAGVLLWVPEPSGLSLLGVASLVALRRCRRGA
jgi:hypothetical protein